MTQMMKNLMMIKISPPFPGPCLKPKISQKPKDKKVIVRDCKNCPIEDPERTKKSIKQLKSFEDKKNKENENNTLKNKSKPNKKPPSTKS
jgi:hypothetical protein